MAIHSSRSCQVSHSFNSIQSNQLLNFNSFLLIQFQFIHVSSFVSINSLQFLYFIHFIHDNSFVSTHAFQFLHVKSLDSPISFQFTSSQLTMNSYKPRLFFETSTPARAWHYLVLNCNTSSNLTCVQYHICRISEMQRIHTLNGLACGRTVMIARSMRDGETLNLNQAAHRD